MRGYNLLEDSSDNSGRCNIIGSSKSFYDVLGKCYPLENGSSSDRTSLRVVRVDGVSVFMKSDWDYIIITKNISRIKRILENSLGSRFGLEKEDNIVCHKFGFKERL